MLQYLLAQPAGQYRFFDTSIASIRGKPRKAFKALAAWAKTAARKGKIATAPVRSGPPPSSGGGSSGGGGGGGGGGAPTAPPVPGCPVPLPGGVPCPPPPPVSYTLPPPIPPAG
jgi:hypothetical protein